MTIDLDAYFTRIGYAGPRDPNLKVLRAIHAHHPMAIPFENLDPLNGRPIKLDHASLEAKLVQSNRGGYCFEQNTLLKAVLDQLGFKTTILTGRVLWMLPPEAPMPTRIHMILRVDLPEGAWIADVGFGGHLSTAPVKLELETVQETPAGTLRLAPHESGALTLQLRHDKTGEWLNVYRFTLDEVLPIDIELANWFTSTHPTSRFVKEAVIQKLTPDCRISLVGSKLTRRWADGRVEEEILSDEARSSVIAGNFTLR
ncbi:MAG TPA: arylamine N-acetyltransferase [Stellaceae bacterium]|jgi:N-hydroxyarylamine O-acetyltransferase|nr:arylamine N-acetyltransferase [Stellaceae bacterium]